MLLSEYTTHAAKTAIYPREVARFYTVENLVAEIAEVLASLQSDDDLLSEAGDVLWQLAMTNLEHHIGLEADLSTSPAAEPLRSREQCATDLVISGGYLISRHAKLLRDGAGAVSGETMHQAAAVVLEDLRKLVAHLGVTLDEAAAANLQKLSSRARRGVLVGDGDHR